MYGKRKMSIDVLKMTVTIITHTKQMQLHTLEKTLLLLLSIHLWKRLFTGTVPVNKEYLTGTVPVNKEHLTGTVPVNKKHLTGTLKN